LHWPLFRQLCRDRKTPDGALSNTWRACNPWHSAAVYDATPPGPPINGVVITVTPIAASNYANVTAEIQQSAASAGGRGP
jgi:hypothetical protein